MESGRRLWRIILYISNGIGLHIQWLIMLGWLLTKRGGFSDQEESVVNNISMQMKMSSTVYMS